MKSLSPFKHIIVLCIILLLTNCSTDNSNFNIETTNVSVKLKSTSGNYQEVFIEVIDVHVKIIDDESVPNCWLSLNAINKGIYNLPDITEDTDLLLVDKLNIPSGVIYEIKLVLGNNNSMVLDNVTFALHMPSVHQEGLINRIEQNLRANTNYEFVLDFEIDQSILITNTPNYIILRPSIKATLHTVQN